MQTDFILHPHSTLSPYRLFGRNVTPYDSPRIATGSWKFVHLSIPSIKSHVKYVHHSAQSSPRSPDRASVCLVSASSGVRQISGASVRPSVRASISQCMTPYVQLSVRPSHRASPFRSAPQFRYPYIDPTMNFAAGPLASLSICSNSRPSVPSSVRVDVHPCVRASRPPLLEIRPSVRLIVGPSVRPLIHCISGDRLRHACLHATARLPVHRSVYLGVRPGWGA